MKQMLKSNFVCLLLALAALLFSQNWTASAEPDSNVFEIYESRGSISLDAPPAEMVPLVLKVPSNFLYGRPQATRTFGVNILTYYPSFTSPADAENARFGLNCVGICNGQVLVSVENRIHSIDSKSPNMGDFIGRASIRWDKTPPYPANVTVTELDPRSDGFDEAFERRIISVQDGSLASVKRVYLRKGADGEHFDLTAVCNVNTSKTACILHFSLACNAAAYISVHGVDGSYLRNAADIKEKTDRFVSRMVANSACSK